jgi:carboxypeptidase family protein
MKRAILLMLALAGGVFSQQRDVRSTMPLPSPSSAGTVTLSLAEYNRLSELATKKPKELKTAPQPYALTQSVFRLRVEDSSVRGTVNISGVVLANGAARVPLTSGLTVLEAKQVGNPLPLIEQSQSHFAILRGPASFDVSLDVASAVNSEAGRASIIFPVPSASSAVLTLDLPGNHANVRVEPGIITSRTSVNGHTVVDASLEPGKPVKLWWTTREILTPTAQREIRFLSSVKTVVAVGDSQLRSAALCDISVIQGEPTEFSVRLPQGFELTDATGSTLESKEIQGDKLILHVREPAQRTHQFLIAIERTNRETKAEAPLLTFAGSQHESGELLVEGIGAMDLVPKESGGLRRMDVREVGAIAKSLARFPLQAAYRYNRRPGDEPRLNLEWRQFDDTQVLSALVEKATITTLSNVAGKSLTEMTLRLRNHAQPFVKVQLPAGATLVSAEVGGERVQPLNAADGTRVPLLRAGFNPAGAYTVSFVYLNDGNAFTKRGAYQMGLPKIDIPINLLTWEIFLPERLEVRAFEGNALSAELFSAAAQTLIDELPEEVDPSSVIAFNSADLTEIAPGQIGGIIVAPNGAVVPGATVTVTNKQTGVSRAAQSDGEGRWLIDGMDAGPVSVSVNQSGFNQVTQDLELSKSRPTRMGTTLQIAGVTETVTIQSGVESAERENRRLEEQVRKAQQAQMNAPSQNVYNLQRRVAGVLPVRIDVPKAGKSYRFVRPLVLDEETNVTFQYRTK